MVNKVIKNKGNISITIKCYIFIMSSVNIINISYKMKQGKPDLLIPENNWRNREYYNFEFKTNYQHEECSSNILVWLYIMKFIY